MESHGMKFVVDTTGVAKGFRDYRAAVDGIFASLSKFEAHVDKTMKGVAKASANPQALNAFKKSVQAFAKVDIDTSAARKLSALSAAMSGFKAPSAGQTANTKKFFNTLGSMPNLTGAYRSVKTMTDLKTAMAGFKAPPASQAKNLAAFAKAMQTSVPAFNSLRGISGISGVANELATISLAMRNFKAPTSSQVTNLGNLALALRAFNFSNLAGSGNFYAALGSISNFKAPSSAQIKNLSLFIDAVARIKVPPNANAVAATLHNIAYAAQKANGSLGGLRTGFGGMGSSFGTFNRGAQSATLQMNGLQNAFSATFQAGSLLRSLLGSLTIAEVGRNFFEATNKAMQFEAQMGVISKQTGFAATQLAFVNDTADAFGMDALAMTEGFGKIAIAANKSGISVGATKEVFRGFSTEMAVLGVSTAKQNDAWLAVQQVMNKGYLSAEELNQQLNEVMPGAMAYAGEYAKSLGTTLEKGLKNKVLDAEGVLLHMAKRMREDFGPAVEDALMRPAAQMNILRNRVNKLFQEIGKAGGNDAFTKLLSTINSKLTPDAIDRYAHAIGTGLKNAVDKITSAFEYLYANWDSIKGPLSTTLSLLGKWMMISAALQIGKVIVSPLIGVGRAAMIAGPVMWDLVMATRALSAANLTAYMTSLAKIGNPAIASGTASLAQNMSNLSKIPVAGPMINSLGRIPALVKGASGAVLGLAAAIGTGLTAAWGIATQAAEGSAGGVVSVNYSASEIIKGMWLNTTDGISGLWDTMTDYVTKLGDYLRDKIGFNFSDILDVAGKVAFGIYYGFTKAFEAIMRAAWTFGSSVGNTIGMIGSSLGLLLKGDFSGAAAKAHGAITGKGIAAGLKEGFGDFKFSGTDMANTAAKVGMGRNAIAGFLNSQGERGRGPKKPERPKKATYEQDLFDAIGGRPRDSKTETDPKGGGKGKKPKSAEDQANKIENAVDQLMGKFAEVDPLGDLYRDFVKNLTDEAHVLLNDKGYQQFLANIRTGAKDGKVSVDALINAMKEGGNLSSATMADLKTRYGKDVQGMIDLLVAQQAAYENSMKDATIKAMDFKFQTAKDMMDAIGDGIPRVKQLSDTISQMTPLAKALLPNNDFKAWLGDLRSGAVDSSMSVEDLANKIVELAGKTPVLDQGLKQLGLTAEQAAEHVRGLDRQLEHTRRMAERDVPFGAASLRDLDQQTMKIGLSEREAAIQERLNAAVKDYLASKQQDGALTADRVKGLEAEIRKRQELADQLKRNADHFANNGVRNYINDIKDAGTAVQDLDKNFLQSLEDQLVNLGTKGTFSFKSIFNTLHEGMSRFASQYIMKGITSTIFGQDALNNGSPSIFGDAFKSLGFDTGPAKEGPLGAKVTKGALWVQVVGSAGMLGTDYKTGDYYQGRLPGGSVSIEDAANDNSLGATAARLGSTGDVQAKTTELVAKTTAETASGFGSAMTSIMPMIGMAFAGSFKSPIAQIGSMFGMMLIQKMMSSQMAGGGGGGLGGIFGKLLGIGASALGVPAGGFGSLVGGVDSMMAANAGIFKEGGYSNSPVARLSGPSMFAGAPHYSEGTANTSGIPAILHDNEAVIPLSRGRKVPVEMSDGGSKGTVVNNNWNITTPNPGGFRKSQQQMVAGMHSAANRAYSRNN